MADSGYSGTPLAKKIGIKPGHRVSLPHRPDDWDIPGLPDGVVFAGPPADVTVAFFRSHDDLVAEAARLTEDLADDAMLWIVRRRENRRA